MELEVSGPKQVAVGEEIAFELTVSNRGQVPVAGLLVKGRCDPGLEYVRDAEPGEYELESLAPGESRRIDVKLRATRPGSFGYTIELSTAGKILATEWSVVTATGPDGQDSKTPPETESETGPDLGPPLVANPDQLVPLHPKYPVWITRDRKSVVMLGQICQRQFPLELFACLRGSKEHESVVVVDTLAHVVHAGLLAAGAEPGDPVEFRPEYVPARGPEIEVTVLWKDEQGQTRRAPGQDWVRNTQTRKAMQHPWVFAGSRFVKDEDTGEQYYLADAYGELICVSNFPSAMLDLPIASSDSNAALLFEAFTENIPPLGTPVTLVLTPKLEQQAKSSGAKENPPEPNPDEPDHEK